MCPLSAPLNVSVLGVEKKAICRSDKLSKQDRALSSWYRKSIEAADNKDILSESQRTWLADVRNHCAEEECLEAAYRERAHYLISVLAD